MDCDINPRQKVELGSRGPMQVGQITIHPAASEVSGLRGRESLEPQVMKVLVALIDADGRTVTRDDLIARCWNGRIVGEDSINRIILKVRQLSRGIAVGSFTIRTITKVGNNGDTIRN